MKLARHSVFTAAFLFLSSAAYGADLVEPQFSWTSVYFGGFGGWAFDAQAHFTPLVCGGGTCVLDAPYNGPRRYAFDGDGLIAGGQIGGDVQSGWAVFGIQAEGGVIDLSASGIDPNSAGAFGNDTKSSFDTNWLVAVTGRLGAAFDRFLVYGRGGIAVLDAEAKTIDGCVDAPCGPSTIRASESDGLVGWTAGGGVEYAITDYISIGAEYRYFNFKGEDLSPGGVNGGAQPGGKYRQNVELDDFQTVRAQINFRWPLMQ